jgi:hypothetical protein
MLDFVLGVALSVSALIGAMPAPDRTTDACPEPPSGLSTFESLDDGSGPWHLPSLSLACLKKAKLAGSFRGMTVRTSGGRMPLDMLTREGRTYVSRVSFEGATIHPGEYVSADRLRLLGGTKEDGRWCFDLEGSDGARERICAAPQPDHDGVYLAPDGTH